MTTAALQRITPLLYVDTIEPSLPFWRDALGFSLTIQVPHGDGLGFAALEKDGLEIMLQTIASLRHDAPTLADAYRGDKTWLFIEVDDIEAIEARIDWSSGLPCAAEDRLRRHRNRIRRARRPPRRVRAVQPLTAEQRAPQWRGAVAG
ncbi:hypothetical protein PEC18_19240 [Paucibacter sp. O1-1]|nr:hypothetical protein [Paucibacter sp. O1-1]MDA3827923.1 hypothetical protein [Paucibacter sp. O1-1]